MNKKKLLVLAMTLSIVAILAIGGTLAYFTSEQEENNVIVIGNIGINLYESQYHRGAGEGSYLAMTNQPQPLQDSDIVADDATYHEDYLANHTLMPFDLKADHRVQYMFEACTVAKNAYVENIADHGRDVFVRVKYYIPEVIAEYLDIFYVDTQFITANDEIANTPAIELDNDDKSEPMITTVNPTAANAAQQIVEKTDDGRYVASFIYAERLTPGEFTLYSPISKITLIPTVDEGTLNDIGEGDFQFEIQVEAEAIQADGFATALEAFKAFDRQMEPQV